MRLVAKRHYLNTNKKPHTDWLCIRQRDVMLKHILIVSDFGGYFNEDHKK